MRGGAADEAIQTYFWIAALPMVARDDGDWVGLYGMGYSEYMLDLSWAELLVVVAVAVLVLGPKEIPGLMHGLGRIVRRLQYVRYAFTQQFEDLLRESDLDDIRKSVNFEAKDFDETQADEEFLEMPKIEEAKK